MESIIRHLLLKLDPERAHAIAQQLLRLRGFFPYKTPVYPRTVFGLSFQNPVGLAAGWDKDAACIDGLFRLGFGFVEVGTVTPKPQMGNEKPRLFRIPEKFALINRMGFNNAGVDALVEKIKVRKTPGILGVNIGKNKETVLEKAVDDYQLCLKAVYPYADYVVVNISSPNTPGLRELQSDHYLKNLLQDLTRLKKNLAGVLNRDVPLLVKTTVDFPEKNVSTFVETLIDFDIAGVVISNTTLDHSAVEGCLHAKEAGGLSGAPLRARVSSMIKAVHTISEKKLSIIGVGGILNAEDSLSHLRAGASLVQIFSGFVYRGSPLIAEILDSICYKDPSA
ncbi:MAG: quinone-dependent dihydroorotate dehydrogenase [Coxiellaceae bacterium]|nr:quinone-dependent dihydroorotate dehydrogenase [Coxiellaceae bacterium]